VEYKGYYCVSLSRAENCATRGKIYVSPLGEESAEAELLPPKMEDIVVVVAVILFFF